jgi:hypothetical protein
MIDWKEPVVPDYRKRTLIDQGSPILAFKANRDRFTRGEYAGWPYLGSRNSEDALTWNVFRSLQIAGRLDLAADVFGLSRPTGLLLWGLAPEKKGENLQCDVGGMLRSVDGKRRGQMTEPDVILVGREEVAIIECKLGEPDEPPSRPWAGSGKRWEDYQKDLPELLKLEVDVKPIYQLVRMAFYAVKLGYKLDLQSVLVSLSNQANWTIGTRRTRPLASLWDDFVGSIGAVDIRCVSAHWQDIERKCADSGLDKLVDYLAHHPCLRRDTDSK